MKNPVLSIVIPAFNEEGNIHETHRRILGALEGCVESMEILFVDDGSTDGTARVVADLHDNDARVGLIQFSRNFGHQAALMAGLDHAKGDAVIAMDADLQHPPEILPELIARWRDGASIVQTVREDAPTVGAFKRMTSRCFYAILRRLTNIPILPGAADFFLLDRKVIQAVNQCREMPRFTRGLIPWMGFERKIVGYVCGERFSGKSKYSLFKMIRFALDGIFAFSIAPIRIAGAAGLIATALGMIYLLYAVIVRLFGFGAAPGWASLLAVIVLIGGIQFLILWILGEYIARIAQQVRHRPAYLTARIIPSDRV